RLGQLGAVWRDLRIDSELLLTLGVAQVLRRRRFGRWRWRRRCANDTTDDASCDAARHTASNTTLLPVVVLFFLRFGLGFLLVLLFGLNQSLGLVWFGLRLLRRRLLRRRRWWGRRRWRGSSGQANTHRRHWHFVDLP